MDKIVKFIFNLFRKIDYTKLDFKPGQKVFCSVTHEVWLSEVTAGVIIRWACKKKSYWAFSDTPSDWYLVKYVNGLMVILPKDRIKDLKQSYEDDKKFYEEWKSIGFVPGSKGFSSKSISAFEEKQIEKQRYL